MKILTIGNSFGQDAHRWLHDIGEAAGADVFTVGLFIGGCSLERHWNNMKSGEVCYMYEVNGHSTERQVSLIEGLHAEQWDIITLQQVSGLSGRPQSYVPYLTDLADFVRRECPGAKLYLQQTWAYEKHSDFVHYHNDQQEMYRRLTDAYEMASRLIDAPVIPVGQVIQYLREQEPLFADLSLTRDGFHLSWNYGRFAAGATWFAALCGGDILQNDFVPHEGDEVIDPERVAAIRRAVAKLVRPL